MPRRSALLVLALSATVALVACADAVAPASSGALPGTLVSRLGAFREEAAHGGLTYGAEDVLTLR